MKKPEVGISMCLVREAVVGSNTIWPFCLGKTSFCNFSTIPKVWSMSAHLPPLNTLLTTFSLIQYSNQDHMIQ